MLFDIRDLVIMLDLGTLYKVNPLNLMALRWPYFLASVRSSVEQNLSAKCTMEERESVESRIYVSWEAF